MENLLAKKQTEEQIRSNDQARFQFVLSMMNMDVQTISPLLKKDGVFFGKLNRWQMLQWLNKQFKKLNADMFQAFHTEGISLGFFPGSVVFHFKYVPMDMINLGEFLSEMEGSMGMSSNENDAVILRLVVLFEDGKIADIRRAHLMVKQEELGKLQQQN